MGKIILTFYEVPVLIIADVCYGLVNLIGVIPLHINTSKALIKNNNYHQILNQLLTVLKKFLRQFAKQLLLEVCPEAQICYSSHIF